MKQRMIARLLAISLLVVPALQVSSHAVDAAPAATQASNTSYYILRDKTGEIVDYNLPVPLESIEPRGEDGTYLKKTLIETGSVSHYDCGYHPQTPIWSNPAWYHFTESTTITISFNLKIESGLQINTGLDISATASSTSSATKSYQADQNRQSKIRVYGDFDYAVYKGEVRSIYTDELIYSFTYSENVKTGEFFEVVYKT